MRPQTFEEFIGQEDAISQIRLALSASKKRAVPIDHVLLSGPAGLGKTTIAQLISKSTGGRCVETAAQVIKNPSDVLAQIINLRDHDVLFIDEIHDLPINVQEFLYPAMEDYKVTTVSQVNRRSSVTVNLNRFVLVGATTIEGRLTIPMLDRFGIVCRLTPYSSEEIAEVVRKEARRENLSITPEAVKLIAARSRFTPRVALKQLRRIHDSSIALGKDTLDLESALHAYKLLRIGEYGLTDHDRSMLKILAASQSAVGVAALASAMNTSTETIETVIEPHLMRLGAVARTPKGRVITPIGRGLIK